MTARQEMLLLVTILDGPGSIVERGKEIEKREWTFEVEDMLAQYGDKRTKMWKTAANTFVKGRLTEEAV